MATKRCQSIPPVQSDGFDCIQTRGLGRVRNPREIRRPTLAAVKCARAATALPDSQNDAIDQRHSRLQNRTAKVHTAFIPCSQQEAFDSSPIQSTINSEVMTFILLNNKTIIQARNEIIEIKIRHFARKFRKCAPREIKKKEPDNSH